MNRREKGFRGFIDVALRSIHRSKEGTKKERKGSLFRTDHVLGTDPLVKLLGGEEVKGEGSLLEGGSLLVGLFSGGSSIVVTNVGIKGGDEHEGLLHDGTNTGFIGLDALDAIESEGIGGIGNETNTGEKVLDHDGLEDIKLKMTIGAGNGNGDVVTHDLGTDHGHGLALGGVDLAGHDGATRLILRELQLTQTAPGAGAKETDVIGDLHEGGGDGVEGTRGLDNGVMGGKGLKLIDGGLEGKAGDGGDLGGKGGIKALVGVEAGTDSSPTLGQGIKARKGGLNAIDGVGHLLNVPGELLAKGEGSGVLKMGTTDLDEVIKALGALIKLITKVGEGGDETVGDLGDGGDVHDGGEGVIAALAHITMVIRMNRGL